MKRVLLYLLLLVMIPTLSGCFYAAAAGLGAYGGYKMKEKGYKVQSPLEKQTQTNKKK